MSSAALADASSGPITTRPASDQAAAAVAGATSAADGSTAELEKLETNLPALARLDQAGRLVFAFGGKLRVRGDASGQFRGRIAITADYE